MVDPLSAMLTGLSPEEKGKLAGFVQGIQQKRDERKKVSRNCAKCGAFMGGRVAQLGEEMVCSRCEERIRGCALCGDASSPDVCPECIAAGARVCEMCLRPAATTGGLCVKCDAEFRGQNAGRFDKVTEAPPTPGAELRSGGGLRVPQAHETARAG